MAAIFDGGIYTWQTTPAPLLNITPSGGNFVISWTVPSTSFVLQETSDLSTTNWTDVPTAPTLNFKNLQNQLTLPLHAGTGFYRLRH